MLEQANGEDSRFSAQPLLRTLLDEGFSPEQVAEAALSQLIAREMACIPEVRAPKRAQPKPLAALKEGCVRLRVSVGRNQKVAPNHIVAAIAECTGISGKRIGKIQCYGDYSLAEVPEELASRIVHEVSGMPIGGIPADLRIYREGGTPSHGRHDRPHRGARHGDARSRSHSTPGRRRK